MTKIFSNNRILIIAFFTVFSVAASPAAMASDSTSVVPVQLKYIGTINKQPLIQLSFVGTADENEFTIVVKDASGNSLYRETIKGENFSKKFLLNNQEIGDETLRFEVISKRTNKTIVFELNPESHLADEVAMSKMK
jgi:uncharacterized protein (DUF2249 family)